MESNLEKFKSMKTRFPEPTQEQIDKLSKRKKREFIQNYEKFLSFEKKIIPELEFAKRELEVYTSAKSYDDVINLTCQGCGENIFGMVCDLCGHNNSNLPNILKMGKDIILESKKYGLPVGEHEKIVKTYEKAVMEKEKNDEIEQFVLDMLYSSGSCKMCKKPLNDVICENCGADNKEHKKSTLKRGVKQFSEHYNVPFQEAAKIIHEKMLKLKDESKINFVY